MIITMIISLLKHNSYNYAYIIDYSYYHYNILYYYISIYHIISLVLLRFTITIDMIIVTLSPSVLTIHYYSYFVTIESY
jgi:hypothetical protein